jgi:hypothetical protein
MSDEFLDAIMNRTGSAGFDIQYSNKYARPTLEKLAADVRSKMDTASKFDRPAKRKRTTRREPVNLTPEERAYKDYDDARQQLTTFLGETLNTPKGISDGQAALTEIINSVSRGRREQQYAAPATSTPESPVPATAPVPAATAGRAVPAPVPAAATATAPANQSTDAPSPSYGRSDEAIAEMEAAQNQPTSAPSPSYGRSDEAIAEMEAAQNQPTSAPSPSYGRSDEAIAETEAAQNQAPKAAPVIDEARMAALFRKTTGTAFDPKSRVDTTRMADLTSFIEKDPDLLNKSDTKIALDYYRTLK